jgi:hypothetical protein
MQAAFLFVVSIFIFQLRFRLSEALAYPFGLFGYANTSFLCGYQFHTSAHVEDHLPAHGVPKIFQDRSEPRPVSAILQVAHSKVLLSNVSLF